jgi:HK97 family phage prohead protease/HK97 family phage major capsid protein
MDPETKIKICSAPELKFADQQDGSLIIEGWVSTNVRDSGGDIVEPEAFSPVIDKYMKKPIVLFMHRFDELPIGKTLSLEIVPNRGLWGKIHILPTSDRGRDIIMLVKNGVINSLSYAYKVKRYEIDEDTETRRIIEFEDVYEISVVNLGMNEDAIFQAAKQLELKSFNNNPGRGRGHKLDPKEIQEQVNKELAPVKSEFQATANDLKTQIGHVARLQNEMKEAHGKTIAEQKEFVEKLSADFTKAVNALTEAQKEINTRVNFGGATAIPFTTKQLLDKDDVELKRVFTEDTFWQIDNFRKANDHVLLADMIMAAKNQQYSGVPFEKRITTLDSFKELQLIKSGIKAMDTATSAEGSQYLPAAYSSRLYEMVRQELEVAGMHPSFRMTQASQTNPVEGADTLATRATQKTTYVAAFDSTEQTPGSANNLYTAEKLRGRTQYSGEADEDLIISVADYVEMKVARSIARAIEKATINGDAAGASGFDTGDVPGSSDCRYCWNGFRQGVMSTSKVDLGTWSEKNLNMIRAKGGKYFKRPDDFYWLTSLTTYLLHCLDPDEMPSFRTVDKYGPSATVATGELGKINGSPLLTSEFILDTYNTAGIYDGVTTTKSIILAVHRNSWMYGFWRDLTMEVVRDAINDVYDVVAYQRLDFQNLFDVATEPVVALGYDVATS